MASPTLITPTSKPTPSLSLIKSKLTTLTTTTTTSSSSSASSQLLHRRQLATLTATILSHTVLSPVTSAWAASDEEYVKETEEVISKVRSTISMDKNDPNAAAAVADQREASNTWVAKYRREKALLGKASFRDIYSALNAVSGHYISFGPTAPIPAKRKARILEEMDTAEKALQRGR